MKKSLLLLLSVLLSLTSSAAYRTFQVNGIYYEQTEAEDNFVKVSYTPDGVAKYSGDVVIPSSVNYGGKSYPVKEIGRAAFWECTGLKSIVLPEGLEVIRNSSFYGCTQLKGVTLPNTLLLIEDTKDSWDKGAFEGCTALKSIYFPPTMVTEESWTPNIGGRSFYGCTGLKTIFVAGKKAGIAMYDVFNGCTSVTDFVSYIESPSAFYVDARSFEGFIKAASLIVPDGKTSAYKNSNDWYLFQHIYERSSYSKAFAVLKAGQGGKLSYNNEDIVRATQVYGVQKGQSFSVTITPDEDHKLLKLLKDGQDVTNKVTNNIYTDGNIKKDFTLEAFFVEGQEPTPQPHNGAATLSIENFSIKAGETKTMYISVNNPGGNYIKEVDYYTDLATEVPTNGDCYLVHGYPSYFTYNGSTWVKIGG